MSSRGLTSLRYPPRPDIQPTVARLKELGVFAGATDHQLKRIAKAGHALSVPEGWSMIWENTPADKAYVVLRGTASVQHDHLEFAQVHEGGLIGEMAVVNHKLRSATVVASTPLEVLHFTREALGKLSDEIPAFRREVTRTVASRAS